MKKGCVILVVIILALFLGACSVDNVDDGFVIPGDIIAGTGGTNTPVQPGDDAAFAACLEQVRPNCVVPQLDTAQKIQASCMSLTNIAIPLSNGGKYGPVTISGGPYGGKIDWNQGAGTEYVNNVNALEPMCLPAGVETFNEPASVNAEVLNTRDLDYSLYTIFRPACMKAGEKYPVITWANGTCGLTHGYGPLLSTIASHGFVIVASNSTWTGATTSPGGIPVQRRAIDYAEYLNSNPSSILYQMLDLDNIGAMGHSQGSAATSTTASDPRVDAVILWNGGTSNAKPFLFVSGDRDVGGTNTPASMRSSTNSASQPGAWIYYHQVLQTGGTSTGHLVLMEQPDRVVDMAIAWWKWRLKGDQQAKNMFVGANCGLCNSPAEYEYGHNNRLN